MPRITVAALLAMLLLAVPAASARPIDSGYPAYPTPEVADLPSYPAFPTPEVKEKPGYPAAPTGPIPPTSRDLLYRTKGNPNVADLVREQESTSGSGNQGPAGPAPASSPASAPDDGGVPWLIVALGIAGAGAAAVTVLVRRNRTRARVAV